MEAITFIIGAMVIVTSLVLIITSLVLLIDNNICKIPIRFFILLGIGIVLCTNAIYEHIHIPKAIDVYQGKTELKISYDVVDNDTISCDSTVVWKEYN